MLGGIVGNGGGLRWRHVGSILTHTPFPGVVVMARAQAQARTLLSAPSRHISQHGVGEDVRQGWYGLLLLPQGNPRTCVAWTDPPGVAWCPRSKSQPNWARVNASGQGGVDRRPGHWSLRALESSGVRVLVQHAWIDARVLRREQRTSRPRKREKRNRGPGHRRKRESGALKAVQLRVRSSSPLSLAFPKTRRTKGAANRPRKCGCLYCPCATGCAALPRGSSSSHVSTGCVSCSRDLLWVNGKREELTLLERVPVPRVPANVVYLLRDKERA